MKMTRKHLRATIEKQVESKYDLFDTGIFYYMAGYAPEVPIATIVSIINELRNEALERG